MKATRPHTTATSSYIEKVINYIPSEIIAAYTAFLGYLNASPTSNSIIIYKILLAILLIVTPLWTYYTVKDQGVSDPTPNKRALFHSFIALFAFTIWVYGIPCPWIELLLGAFYVSALAPVLLVLFTIITPLLERIVLGTDLPIET